MRYVGPRGIPLDEFLRWPQLSQDAALAWSGHEAQRCTGCGRHPDDQPRHPHDEVCLECAAMQGVRTKANDTPGAHVVMVHGTRGDCPTCTAELAENRRGR